LIKYIHKGYILIMSDLRINSIGVRSEEYVTSSPSGKQNAGTIMQIRVPGEKLAYPAARSRIPDPVVIRDALNRFAFFSNLSYDERTAYIESIAVDSDDIYLQEIPGLEVRFHKISGTFFASSLSADQITELIKAGWLKIKDVYQMFPRKPGSKAARHTLIFRPSNWSVMPEPRRTKFFGTWVDGTIIGYGPHDGAVDKVVPDLGIVYGSAPEFNVFDIVREVRPEADIDGIKGVISWFPPSLHKSLIQKIIRTRCTFVAHQEKEYSARDVLLVSFALLMIHPGSFVPNLQKFVTGLEGATKRLAVSIIEDSYIDRPDVIMSLLAAARLCQTVKVGSEYWPNPSLVKLWMESAIKAQESELMFDYDWANWSESNLPIHNTGYYPWIVSYIVLRELGSFDSDISMVGSVARNGGKPRSYGFIDSIRTMDLVHCVDHHSFTDIVHFLPYWMVKEKKDYSDAMKAIWDNVAGIRPRLGQCLDLNLQITAAIKDAQRLVWERHSGEKKEILARAAGKYRTEHVLDDSWIAGLIGPQEFKVGKYHVIVVVRADDIYRYTAVVKPGRNDKQMTFLTEEENDLAVREMESRLRKGVKTKSLLAVPSLANKTCVLTDNGYIIDGALWDDCKRMKVTFPLYPGVKSSVAMSLSVSGDCVMEHADHQAMILLSSVPTDVLHRTYMYLKDAQGHIALRKVGRDGTGSEYSVSPLDTAVCQILSHMTCWYPAGLSADSAGWKIKSAPILWKIRDMVAGLLKGGVTDSERLWSSLRYDDRVLWEHQQESVSALLDKDKQGRTGKIIWAPMGTGKTLIVMRYLLAKYEMGTMPSYLIYTLPAAAIDSVSREFLTHGFTVRKIDMRAKSSSNTILPGVINLVEHDHLRMGDLSLQVKQISSDCMMVVDEFHKTMNKTIRTSVALELASAVQSFIAMTGTLIKDSNVNDLLVWLQMAVPFQVTESNYWVAVGSLISKRVFTGVGVEREEIEVPMSKEYYDLVTPQLGGSSSVLHFKRAVEESYKATGERLISTVKDYVEMGEVVFVNARDISHQYHIKEELVKRGMNPSEIYIISKESPITLLYGDNRGIKVVISTFRHVEGYQLTGSRVAISEVIFSNQATREQWEARINRIGQQAKTVKYITIHGGILSYILKKYNSARTISEALKGFADEVKMNVNELRHELA
jgi:hypothetical protein